MPTVSLLATLVGTLAGFALGALWYGPLFGKAWLAENGFTAEHIEKDFNPLQTYGATFVLGLIAAYVFGWFIGPKPAASHAIGAGVAVGLCWVATAIGTNYLFERRSLKLFLINGGYHVLRFGLVGVAFALLG
jgi:hypothetical protein